MRLYELLSSYEESEYLKKFKEKFPLIFEFSKEVEVLPWREEFGIADFNPEVVDKLEELEEKLKEGLISKEEYEREVRNLKEASRTEGIAFLEKKQVSFRRERPHLSLVLHELGHVFFGESDRIWSSRYGGGEFLMRLIIEEVVDGDEKTVRDFMEFLKQLDENPEKAGRLLDRAAQAVSKKYGLSCTGAREFSLRCGVILFPSERTEALSREECSMFVINMLEGANFKDPLWTECLKELLKALSTSSISISNSSNFGLFYKTNFLVVFLVEKKAELRKHWKDLILNDIFLPYPGRNDPLY